MTEIVATFHRGQLIYTHEDVEFDKLIVFRRNSAAWIQSTKENVAAGSIFATIQSLAVTGTLTQLVIAGT